MQRRSAGCSRSRVESWSALLPPFAKAKRRPVSQSSRNIRKDRDVSHVLLRRTLWAVICGKRPCIHCEAEMRSGDLSGWALTNGHQAGGKST